MQSCAPAKQAAVADLLARLRVPKSAQLLRTALTNGHELLVQIVDEVPDRHLRLYRDAARECLGALQRNPLMSDESYVSAKDITADPVYRMFAHDDPDQSWEKAALQAVLLLSLLTEAPSDDDIRTLAEGVEHAPVIKGTAPPDSLVTRGVLVSHFLRQQACKDARAATLASTVDRYLQELLKSTADPKTFSPASELTEAIDRSLAEAAQAPASEPVERLRRLATSLSVRCSAAIRHQHRPAVHQAPPLQQLNELFVQLRRRNEGLFNWATTHALLSSHAIPLLGGGAHRRIHWSLAETPRISIHALELSRRSKDGAIPTRCEAVEHSLSLPVLNALASRTLRTETLTEEGFGKRKQQFRDFCARWAAEHGVRISLGTVQRLLPIALGGGSSSDETFCHLLALREVTRRDAGIHYFSPSVDEVVRRYTQAVQYLALELGLDDWMEEGWRIEPQWAFFGASLRPCVAAIQELIRHLSQSSGLPRGKPTLDNRLRAHNAEVGLVTIMYLAVTGARPVDDVVPKTVFWSHEAGEIVLSEKDSLLYRSTRKLPLPTRLLAANARLAERQRELEVLFGRRFDHQYPLFLVDGYGVQHPPTIANLKAYVPGFAELWPWPNDILRHYFRTRLWELGCSAEVLEQAMGHLGKSQTPDSPFAMRPIGEPLLSMRPYVDQLLDELGF